MRKILTCVLLVMLIAMLLPIIPVYGEDIGTETHKIVVSKESSGAISVVEVLTMRGTSDGTYSRIKFWVPDEAQNLDVLISNISNNEIPCTPLGNNEHTCNISSFNIAKNSSLQLTISYTLDKDVKEFEKTLMHNTTDISVTFDKNEIYSGENLTSGTSFNLLLYEPAEAPASWYIIVFITLLVILLVISTLYSFRKQKLSKIKDIAGESEELLNTKKALLMSLLKDIEKQHRSKKISDDTHHKLKEYYKRQTVETMKKLDDMKSEIK